MEGCNDPHSSSSSTIPFTGACPTLVHMPVDIFIEICCHLPYVDLFTMMGVCRQFHYWLHSTTSHITQGIWRTSRTKFEEHMKLDPPEGMDEISFIKLSMVERKCQICKSDQEIPNIYWAFRVRLCRPCFRRRITIAPDNIPEWAKTPIDITLVLPHEHLSSMQTNVNVVKSVYLTSDLVKTLRECHSVPPEELGDWIFKKQLIAQGKIEDAAKRGENDKKRLTWLLNEKQEFLRKTVQKLEDTTDDFGNKIYFNRTILIQPSYKKANDSLRIPFMDTDPWPNLYERLKNDYNDWKKNNLLIVQNQNRRLIIRRIIQLITSYRRLSDIMDLKSGIFLNEPVLDCLEWCPSFIKPPEVITDMDDVVRQIRNEAREYIRNKRHRRYGPFSTIEGCISLLTQCNEYARLFKCKLCWGSGRKSYNYTEVTRHLMCQSTHNLYYSDVDDSMIELDFERVKKLMPRWFGIVLNRIIKPIK
ncbi:8360_t:CDS:2 [Funneliformis mosseae]|uniref:8360_t:CDS:1 n=1 Tax=Funneliformis mosseae TaxID=27381 RepID=A0A9N8VBX8_FUNMO|nr:8360_t:CDS:2 [Funneliformis mosseae]